MSSYVPRRKVESLSRHQREVTPLQLCRYLVDRVRTAHGSDRVAVLWVCRRTVYWRLWPLVDLWGERRDARLYAGPWPVVCHPPCGPWGRYRSRCHQSPEHGVLAMQMVHRWGGVVEQPVGSRLFCEHGQGGVIERIEQGDFGHLALKPTLLYWSKA
jgi:hypothetical protein